MGEHSGNNPSNHGIAINNNICCSYSGEKKSRKMSVSKKKKDLTGATGVIV